MKVQYPEFGCNSKFVCRGQFLSLSLW